MIKTKIFGRAASEIHKGKKWVLLFDDEIL
jgi:hypothetical protein